MIVKLGYKEWDTRDWIQGKDLDEKTLECPDCGCRIILKYYNMACGTDALNFCPYCGRRRKRIRNSHKLNLRQMTIEEIQKEGKAADHE